jgi:hypothetical protein
MMLMHDGAMKKILRAKRRRINQSTTVPCLLLLILLLGSYNQRDKLVDFIESSSSSDSFFAVRSSTTTAPSFRLALHESLGFFTDIPDDQWIRRKKLTLETVHHIKGEDFELAEKNPRNWYVQILSAFLQSTISAPASIGSTLTFRYQHNWNPDFSCFFEKSIGDMGEGHKIVCDPHRLPPDCLVYSFGSNRQFGFELGLNGHAPQCEIHIFDYTDYSKNMRRQRVNATYHAWGLKPSYASNGTWSKKYPQTQPMGSIFKTFQETVAELGHEGRRIDILKLDVEGSEVRYVE